MSLNLPESELRSTNPFWNASSTTKGAVSQFRRCGPHFLPLRRPLSDRKIDQQIIKPSHTSTNPQNLLKIGPADSEITCLEFEPLKTNKREKSEAQHIARRAGQAG